MPVFVFVCMSKAKIQAKALLSLSFLHIRYHNIQTAWLKNACACFHFRSCLPVHMCYLMLSVALLFHNSNNTTEREYFHDGIEIPPSLSILTFAILLTRKHSVTWFYCFFNTQTWQIYVSSSIRGWTNGEKTKPKCLKQF